MRDILKRRPSPPMLVAVAALIVALAGTAMAAPIAVQSLLDKKEKKQVKKIAKNQAKNQINQQAPGLTVGTANNANNLGGTPAAGFVQATQWAYGEISSTGAVKASPPNRNIESASNPQAGVYCLQLAFSPTFGTGNGTGASGTGVTANVDIPETNCPAGTEATVYVTNAAGTFVNDDFTVIFGSF